MSYGDEQAEARRLRSILEEKPGGSMTPPARPDPPLDLEELRRLAEAAKGDGKWRDENTRANAQMDYLAVILDPSVILALLDFIESVAATSNDPHLASLAALKEPNR